VRIVFRKSFSAGRDSFFRVRLSDTEVPRGKSGLIGAISYALEQGSTSALVNSSPTYASSVADPSYTSFARPDRASFRTKKVNSRRRADRFFIVSCDDAVGNQLLNPNWTMFRRLPRPVS
jgi:hypothetical protein